VPIASTPLAARSRCCRAHARDPCSDTFSAVLFALAGLPNNAHYTFKHVVGYGSMDAFGKDVDVYTAGGFRRVDELLERILDCNSPRVYTIERVRLAAAPPGAAR